jgi:hypothetical protein
MSASPASAALGQRHVISTQIGVGSPFGPFTVNPTKPQSLNIYVFSERIGSHAFRPFAEIARRGVVVNGVTYHDVKIRRDPVDENKDGIPDAIITITPRSAIGLMAGKTNLTVSGLIRCGTPLAHDAWSGTAPITVSRGVGGTAQPYTAYVAITLPSNTGSAFVNFTIFATPGNPNGLNQTLYPGQTGKYYTANGTGAHMFVLKFLNGNSVTIGPNPPLQYGLSPSPRPNYDAVFAGGCCNYNLVPAGYVS